MPSPFFVLHSVIAPPSLATTLTSTFAPEVLGGVAQSQDTVSHCSGASGFFVAASQTFCAPA